MLRFGDMFYSGFFKSNGVVVDYIDDDNWFFVLEEKPLKVLKAHVEPHNLRWLRRVENEKN